MGLRMETRWKRLKLSSLALACVFISAVQAEEPVTIESLLTEMTSIPAPRTGTSFA